MSSATSRGPDVVSDDPQHGDERDDRGCQEQRGQAASPGDEVAEPGDQRIEDGRDVARSGSGRRGVRRIAVARIVDGRARIRPLFIHGRQGTRPSPPPASTLTLTGFLVSMVVLAVGAKLIFDRQEV